jgi:glycosyltransferase involved in cell wall biosynthesis
MKLSILILTHNRPELFARCLQSVLDQLPPNVEIIVNNDSRDISEIKHPQVSYHYNQYDNISLIYKFLLDQSTGDYVYYLEDDDYLAKEFFTITLKDDLIAGNYVPMYNPSYLLECMRLHTNAIIDPIAFVTNLNLKHLQLSQFIFKRTIIKDFVFPMDNNVHNDINLVVYAASKSRQVCTLNKVLFYQTIDGGDNISFPGSNTRVNIIQSLDFLKNYEIYNTASHNTGS